MLISYSVSVKLTKMMDWILILQWRSTLLLEASSNNRSIVLLLQQGAKQGGISADPIICGFHHSRNFQEPTLFQASEYPCNIMLPYNTSLETFQNSLHCRNLLLLHQAPYLLPFYRAESNNYKLHISILTALQNLAYTTACNLEKNQKQRTILETSAMQSSI